jgi:hypothetical protein
VEGISFAEPIDRETLLAFMDEDVIPLRVKFDDYLSVALDARRACQVIIPGELPDASVLGATIDDRFTKKMKDRRLPGETLSNYIKGKLGKLWRRSEIQQIAYRIEALRQIYSDIVESSHSYEVFMQWATRLGLKKLELESRPTIREVYFFKDPAVADQLEKLHEMRKDIRYEYRRNLKVSSNPIYASAFPEEANPTYLKTLGNILGFPACCIDRYVFDRQSGVLSPEQRSSNQIIHCDNPEEIVDLAYFTKDFFPCQPDCAHAIKKGTTLYSRIAEIDLDTANIYREHLLENVSLVRQYPEIIKQKIQSLKAVRSQRREVDTGEQQK